MSKKEKKLIIISILVSVFLIVLTYTYITGLKNEEPNSEVASEKSNINKPLEVGEPGSTHAHVSFVFSVDDGFVNFHQDKYKELSRFAHFHDEDGIFIHKHAVGVSLPFFLETLGFKVTNNCIILDTGEEYCNKENGPKITMVVNGNIIEDMFGYELQHGDRVLLDYSSDTKTDIRVKAQTTVPKVPSSLMEDSYNTY